MPLVSGEEFQIGLRAALLDNVVEFIGLSRVLALSTADDVDLPTNWSRSTQTSSNAKEHKLSNIT